MGFCHRERQVNKMNHTMKEIPESQRPYEKCIREGENTLSDSELLAVILRCGTRGMNSLTLANDILSHMEQSPYPGLLGLLHCSVSDLKKIHGIGTVKAVQLKCIGELSKRIASTAARISLDFNSPDSIAAYYMEQLRHQEQEIMICMMLDNQNHLLGDTMLSKGTVNATLITPREVYLEALRYHAVNLILIHNHPGGNPAPSKCDKEITERICQAGEMLGINLLDHIIIGDHRYISFRGERIYENPFPGARINDDEIAVTDLLAHMKQYVETGKEFYPLREGLQDAYLSFLMDEAVENPGKEIISTSQSWSV